MKRFEYYLFYNGRQVWICYTLENVIRMIKGWTEIYDIEEDDIPITIVEMVWKFQESGLGRFV